MKTKIMQTPDLYIYSCHITKISSAPNITNDAINNADCMFCNGLQMASGAHAKL